MTNSDDNMTRQRTFLADGRYIIYFAFENSDHLKPQESSAEADAEKPAEPEQRV